MARDLGYTEKFLTNMGANEIVSGVIELTGLSHEEQLRRAALMGFIAAGGASRILSEGDEPVVEIFVRDSMSHMDEDEDFESRYSTAQIVGATHQTPIDGRFSLTDEHNRKLRRD